VAAILNDLLTQCLDIKPLSVDNFQKNTGVPYEFLTRMIFDVVVNQDREGICTIEVKHDITLVGKTTTHQIDVYWEFEVGGIRYITVVQAKDWNNPVSQGELLKFKAVLDDLPSQPRGVFVTRTGYQEGALNFARAQGILLYELREPKELDLQVRLLTINVNITCYFPYTSQTQLTFDESWIRDEFIRLKLQELPSIGFAKDLEEVTLFDQGGKELMTLEKLINSFYPSDQQELIPTKVIHEFDEPTFIETGVNAFPRLKINAIEAVIRVNKVELPITLVAEDFVGFILKNVTEGTERLLNKKGKPLLAQRLEL
jgi:hypothetical protein